MSVEYRLWSGRKAHERSSGLTKVELQLALLRDHVANRHARVGVAECPVCAKLQETSTSCLHQIGCPHDD